MVYRIIGGVAAFLMLCFIGVDFYFAFTKLPDKTCTNVKFYNSTRPSPLAMFNVQDSKLPDCPETPPDLVGPIEAVMKLSSAEEQHTFSHLKNGHAQPADCKARNKAAIIVPFRNRKTQLPVLLYNLHRMLEKQQSDYSIFVIEQTQNSTFNRAKLLNPKFIHGIATFFMTSILFLKMTKIFINALNNQNI